MIMALSGIQTYQLAFNEKVKTVEVLSEFTELREHATSALEGNEKDKLALFDTIQRAERTASDAASRNISLSIVTFCVALLAAFLTERNIKKRYGAVKDEA